MSSTGQSSGFSGKSRETNEGRWRKRRGKKSEGQRGSPQPVRDARESVTPPVPTFRDIKVNLTVEEQELPETSRLVCMFIKKCQKSGFHQAHLQEVKSLLKNSEQDVPAVERNQRDDAVCTYVQDGPTKFYLRWKIQNYQIQLLEGVLSDRCEHGMLKRLTVGDNLDELNGKVVIARRFGTASRALIKRVINQSQVIAYFVDHGNVATVNLSSLWEYPRELTGINPLCFEACIKLLNSGENFDQVSGRFFASLVENTSVKCTVVRFMGRIAAVSLSMRITPVQHEVDVVEILRREKLHREQDPHCNHLKAQQVLEVKFKSAEQLNLNEIVTTDRRPRKVKVASIRSPSEFCLIHIPIDSWITKPKAVYQNWMRCQELKIKTGHPVEGHYYVWYERRTEQWHRVKVLKFPAPAHAWGMAFLWLIDEGRTAYGWEDSMLEMDRNVCIFPKLAIQAHLAHVDSIGDSWSDDSVQYFQRLCKDKVFDAIILTAKAMPAKSLYPESHGVILAETGSVTFGTIQASLTAAGMCTPTGFAAGRRDISYHCIESLFQKSNPADGQDAQDTALRKNRESSPHRHYVHPSTDFGGNDPKLLYEYLWSRSGCVEIQSCHSPDNFYIQMIHRRAGLDNLVDELKKHVTTVEPLPPVEVVPGNVYIAEPLPNQPIKCWGRVAIFSVDVSSGVAKGVNIDYGYTTCVDSRKIYTLSTEFERITPFCHRAHLDFSTEEDDDHLLVPRDDEWSPRAKEVWSGYISSADVLSIYYVWQIRPGGAHSIVDLEEFGQQLRFDRQSLTWHPARCQKSFEYAALDRNKDNRLLRQFYRSIGVNAVFEKKSHTWNFEFVSILDSLVRTGHIVEV